MEKKKRTFMLLALSSVPALGFSCDIKSALVLSVAVLISLVVSRVVIYPLTLKSSKGASFIITLLVSLFVTSALMMMLEAFLYDVYQKMEVYFALTALSGIALSVTSDSTLTFKECILDTLSFSMSFIAAVVFTSLIREIFGSGSFWGLEIGFIQNYRLPILLKAHGGFMTYAFALALINGVLSKKEEKK